MFVQDNVRFFQFYHLPGLPIIFLPSKKVIILNSKQGGLDFILVSVSSAMIGKNSISLSAKHQAPTTTADASQTLNVFLKTNDDVRLGDLGVPSAGKKKRMEDDDFGGWLGFGWLMILLMAEIQHHQG